MTRGTMSAPFRTPDSPAALVSVYSGRECLGFIISRGKAGYEAFDAADNKSLGVFASMKLAADAVSDKNAS
jgi:hypothetical protein